MPKGSALSDAKRANAAAIWALGITQIIGYGTLYYRFSILAPSIAAEFEEISEAR
jgi:hypothetical protein